jgi:hypothetical protein
MGWAKVWWAAGYFTALFLLCYISARIGFLLPRSEGESVADNRYSLTRYGDTDRWGIHVPIPNTQFKDEAGKTRWKAVESEAEGSEDDVREVAADLADQVYDNPEFYLGEEGAQE